MSFLSAISVFSLPNSCSSPKRLPDVLGLHGVFPSYSTTRSARSGSEPL